MRRSLRRGRALGSAALLWLLLSLLEIALLGKLDPQETPAGIAVALIASAATVAGARAANAQFRLRWRWLGLAPVVARNIVRDTFIVFGALLRAVAGRPVRDAFLEIPFDPGGTDSESAARRALVVAGISTSPNEIVLAVDKHRRVLRVHVLVRSSSARHSRAWPL